MTKQQSFTMSPQIDSIVVVPTLNEAAHIDAVIRSLRSDECARERSEVWIVDGGSTDGTPEIVERLSAQDPGIRFLHNPDRRQGCAVNLAGRTARLCEDTKYLIRADAHCRYPDNWISRLIATAEEENADSVVVPMRTCGGGAMGDAAADLFNSWLGTGGSPHRIGATRGFVDHGHHALFRLNVFLGAGGYDPAFTANEDAELDVRIKTLGRRIFLENQAAIDYFPRNTMRGVARQFYRNGRFRVLTSLKHKTLLGARQLAPMTLVMILIACGLAGLFVEPAILAPIALYFLAVLMSAAMIATAKSPRRIGLIFLQAVTAHLAFGLGALQTTIGIRPKLDAPAEPALSAGQSSQ